MNTPMRALIILMEEWDIKHIMEIFGKTKLWDFPQQT